MTQPVLFPAGDWIFDARGPGRGVAEGLARLPVDAERDRRLAAVEARLEALSQSGQEL